MKRIYQILFTLLALNFVFLAGCGDGDDVAPPDNSAFFLLKDHMAANNLDLSDMLSDWIVDPPTLENVDAFLDSYFIMDIRGQAYFNAGHIEGAFLSTLAKILDDAVEADKPILVVDQTGQNSGHGMVALRLSGYPDAQVLRWGMAGWNNAFSRTWLENIGDAEDNLLNNWVDAPGNISENKTYNPPHLNTIHTIADSILVQRVGWVTGGVADATHKTVLTSPTGYFVNNFWDAGDVAKYGHIKGAYRIKPLSIAGDEIFNLDASYGIIIYSFAGQSSSVVTAWLRVLGYNAETLLYGANGMIYSKLEDNKYMAPTTDLPFIKEIE